MPRLDQDPNHLLHLLPTQLGEVLRAARALLGMTTSEITAETGISRSALHMTERNGTQPRWNTLQKLVDLYTNRGVEFHEGGWVRLKPQTQTPPPP
jgi:transcriptional regulator with XRE-family HTH domain